MARKRTSTAAACAVAATFLLSAGGAHAGIVIVGETPPSVDLIVAGEENGLFVQHGEAGDRVKIYGHGFAGATAVRFGSTDATFAVEALGYQVEATAPPGDGTVPVTVTTPTGTSKPSFGDHFTYTTPPVKPPSSPPTPGPTSASTSTAVAVSAPPMGTKPLASVPLPVTHAPTQAKRHGHRHRHRHGHRKHGHRNRQKRTR